MTICQHNVYYLVILLNVDGTHTLSTNARVVFQGGTLYDTVLCCKDNIVACEEFLIAKLLAPDSEECIDSIVRLQLEQILYSTSLGILCALWYLEATQPIYTALLGEEEYHIVSICCIDVFCEVLLTGTRAARAHTATCLSTEVCLQGTLDVSQVRHCDDNRVVSIELLRVELCIRELYLCATLVTIFLLHLLKLVLHHLLTQLWVIQNLLQVSNEFHYLLVFSLQFLYTQTCQL